MHCLIVGGRYAIYGSRPEMSLSYRYGHDIGPREGCVAGWQMLSEISRSERLQCRARMSLTPIPSKTDDHEDHHDGPRPNFRPCR